MRVVFRRLAGALCYQCAVLSVRFDDSARLGFRGRLYLLGGGAGKVFWVRCFCPGARGNYLIAGILQAISPGLAGWTYGLTGSYRIAFISATLLSRLGALCTWFLRVPSPPGEIESMPG